MCNCVQLPSSVVRTRGARYSIRTSYGWNEYPSLQKDHHTDSSETHIISENQENYTLQKWMHIYGYMM